MAKPTIKYAAPNNARKMNMHSHWLICVLLSLSLLHLLFLCDICIHFLFWSKGDFCMIWHDYDIIPTAIDVGISTPLKFSQRYKTWHKKSKFIFNWHISGNLLNIAITAFKFFIIIMRKIIASCDCNWTMLSCK